MSERNDTKINQYAERVKTRSVKFEIWQIITQLPPDEYLNDRLLAIRCQVVKDGVNRPITEI